MSDNDLPKRLAQHFGMLTPGLLIRHYDAGELEQFRTDDHWFLIESVDEGGFGISLVPIKELRESLGVEKVNSGYGLIHCHESASGDVSVDICLFPTSFNVTEKES